MQTSATKACFYTNFRFLPSRLDNSSKLDCLAVPSVAECSFVLCKVTYYFHSALLCCRFFGFLVMWERASRGANGGFLWCGSTFLLVYDSYHTTF